MDVKEMTQEECMEALSSGRMAHLACCNGDRPYIVPVYYALAGNYIYSFSRMGKKIELLRSNPNACVLVERVTDDQHWISVLVHGRYQELPDTVRWHQERIHAWSLLEHHVNWWEPGGLKPTPQAISSTSISIFYSIEIEEISGRIATPGDQWTSEPSYLQD